MSAFIRRIAPPAASTIESAMMRTVSGRSSATDTSLIAFLPETAASDPEAYRSARAYCSVRHPAALRSANSCFPHSQRSRLWRPAMRLALTVHAPRVQRVVYDESVLEHLVIIAEVMRQAQRDGEQSRRFRREM